MSRNLWTLIDYQNEISLLREEGENYARIAARKHALADELVKETVKFTVADLPLLSGSGLSDDPRTSRTEDGTTRID